MAGRAGLVKDVPAPRAEPDEERAPLAWWQLRSWRIDRSILIRVRDGLHALAPAPSPAAEAPLSRETAPAPAAGESSPGQPAAGGPDSGESYPGKSDPREPAPGELPARGPVAETPATGQTADDAAADSGGLTEPAVAAVRSTFAIVAEAADKVPGYFYGQLFARDPKLRELFPPAMSDQRDRLVKALVRIVESLTTPEEMAAYLAQLGRDHRKYRIEPEMYEVVGAALLATLRRFAGPAFTPAAEQAWTDAYAAVSALMIQAADEAGATAPAFWPAEVVDIEERFRGMAVLTIALDQGMRFEAGQHVTVQHPRWPRVWRSYSIAGCPREDGLVQLHVKVIPGGWVSNALVRSTYPGSQLTLGPPLGTMTLAPAEDPGPGVRGRRHRARPDQGHRRAGGTGLGRLPAADPPVRRGPAAGGTVRPAGPVEAGRRLARPPGHPGGFRRPRLQRHAGQRGPGRGPVPAAPRLRGLRGGPARDGARVDPAADPDRAAALEDPLRRRVAGRHGRGPPAARLAGPPRRV